MEQGRLGWGVCGGCVLVMGSHGGEAGGNRMEIVDCEFVQCEAAYGGGMCACRVDVCNDLTRRQHSSPVILKA